MEGWPVEELLNFVRVAYASGLASFVVRRTVQRLEKGEISIEMAVELIERGLGHRHPEAGAGTQACDRRLPKSHRLSAKEVLPTQSLRLKMRCSWPSRWLKWAIFPISCYALAVLSRILHLGKSATIR